MILFRLVCFYLVSLGPTAVAVLAEDTGDVRVETADLSGLELLEQKAAEGQLNELEHILLKHFRRVFTGRMESVLVQGNYTIDGHEFVLKIAAKRPGFLHQTLTLKKVDYEGGYDGETYWYKGPSTEGQPLAELNEDLLHLECDFGALLWRYELNGVSELSQLDEDIFEGSNCHIIERQQGTGEFIRHYIEVRTGREKGRSLLVNKSGISYDIRLVYGAPVRISAEGGHWISGYQLWINGELYASAEFDSVRFNSGLMPWSFKKP